MKIRNSTERVLCIVLICILIVGAIAVPVQFSLSEKNERQISDYFYIRFFDGEGQTISKYQVTLTGTVSRTGSSISSVSFSRVSGDTCITEYEIDGNRAYVKITHPVEGALERIFSLSTSGVFSVY